MSLDSGTADVPVGPAGRGICHLGWHPVTVACSQLWPGCGPSFFWLLLLIALKSQEVVQEIPKPRGPISKFVPIVCAPWSHGPPQSANLLASEIGQFLFHGHLRAARVRRDFVPIGGLLYGWTWPYLKIFWCSGLEFWTMPVICACMSKKYSPEAAIYMVSACFRHFVLQQPPKR